MWQNWHISLRDRNDYVIEYKTHNGKSLELLAGLSHFLTEQNVFVDTIVCFLTANIS